MLKAIQKFYEKKIRPVEGVTSREATGHSLMLATAALLIEAARADHEVRPEELGMVASAVQKTFDISDEETAEIIGLADEEVRESASFYQFTRLINKGFSYEQKKDVVERLWRVVFADAELEKHEEHLVRRVADLLHVEHRDFIDARRKARDS